MTKSRVKWALGILGVLALFISNVGVIIKPATDLGHFQSDFTALQMEAHAATAAIATHEIEDHKKETDLARELGELNGTLRQMNERLNEIKNVAVQTQNTVKHELT